MRFALEIDMENAAFEDADELPELLHTVARKINGPITQGYGPILDSNGNTVGSWDIS